MPRKTNSNQHRAKRLFKDVSWGTAMFISTALLIAAFILLFSYTGCMLDKKQEETTSDKTVIVNEKDTLR